MNWYLRQHHGQLHCLRKLLPLVSQTGSHILSKRKHRCLITTHVQHRRVTVYEDLQTEEVVTVPSLRASLVEFVVSAASEVQYQMLKVYLAGIKHHHQLAGMPDPVATSIRLPLILRGIKQRGLRLPPKPRLPITIKIIGQMTSALRERLDLSTDDRHMYWDAFITAFFGFLRCSEFTTPSVSNCDKDQTLVNSNLTTDGNRYRLHINAAKMDPFCLGVNLFLRRKRHSVCPVKALKNYLARPSESDLPQFVHADGSFLTPLRLTSTLWSLLYKLGYNEDHYASQLLDESSNNCSRCWPARLADQNSRPLVFRLLPTIHTTEWQRSLFCGKRAR